MLNKDKLERLGDMISSLRISNANEAETRKQLIDYVLYDILEWEKDEVTVEQRADEDGKISYLDYKFSAGRQSIVVEAKRISDVFDDLPSTRRAKLGEKWAKSGKAASSIRQARDYARSLGIGHCIATNGISWIIFPVNRRDQVSYEHSEAIIFEDVGLILSQSPDEFLSLLSRSEILSGRLDKILLDAPSDQLDNRRLNDIYDKSYSRVNRASIFHAIEHEIITAFSEELLTDNPSLLEKCYVDTPERTRFDSRIHMYLSGRDQVLRTRPIRPVGRKGDKNIVRNLIDTRLATRSIALLTVGLVGSGKTTFLNHVAKVTAREQFAISEKKPAGCWIWVDFRDFSLDDTPRNFAIDRIFQYIKEHPYLNDYDKVVSKAYKADIDALTKGPLKLLSADTTTLNRAITEVVLNEYNCKTPYVERIIGYVSREFPVFLVIDNVDQIEDADRQAQIFLEATGLARTLRCSLVLAMRDSTYVKNRSSAVFDAFDFDAVYIDPPSILSVLSKRFSVAGGLLSGKSVEFLGERGGKIEVPDARVLIEMLGRSVLGTEVGTIIEVAAAGDVRLALQMTRQFLQYGYSSTGRAIEIYQRTGRYLLPAHEALRALMLGNQNIYREDFSVFGNPFDARLGRSDLQFARLYVMNAFVLMSSEREFEGLSVRDVMANLEAIGIGNGAARKVINDLIYYRYLYTRSHHSVTEDSILFASRFCGYIVRELIGRLMFIETVLFDTFISEDSTWEDMKARMSAIYRERDPLKKFKKRKEVANDFFEYCERKTEGLVSAARKVKLAIHWTENPLTKVKPAFVRDVNRATQSAARNIVR